MPPAALQVSAARPPPEQSNQQALTKKTPSMANLLLPISKADRRSSSASSTKQKSMRLSTLNLDISPNNKSKRVSTIPMPGSRAGSRRSSNENGSRRPSKVVPRLTAESCISDSPSPITPTEEDNVAPPADELEQAIMAIALQEEAANLDEVGGQSSKSRRERPSHMPLTHEELQELRRVVDEHWLVRGERYFRLLDFSREMHEDKWADLQKTVHGCRLRVAGLIDGWTPRAGTKQGLLRMYTASELKEEQEQLRQNLSYLTVSNTWFLHKSLRKARWVTMQKYRCAKQALMKLYQEKLEEWRSDAKTNPFKHWMLSEADKQEEESDETAFDISSASQSLAPSASGSFTAGSFAKEERKGTMSMNRSSNQTAARSKSTMYWLLVAGERSLDDPSRALPLRCRDLLKQLQQHGQLLKQQLRNAQKAGFLDELIGALTNVDQEARKEVEDIHQQLAVLVGSVHKDQFMLDQHRTLEGADLKSMEAKQQRLELTLKTCLTAINSESHWLGTLRADTQGGCVDNLRQAREKLIELDQKRPFPMLIHCRLGGDAKKASMEDSRLSGTSPSSAIAGLRKGQPEGLDARLVITALQEPVMAAKSMSRSIQQWQTLAGKRVNQVSKVMSERKTYIAGRSRAQEARRKQVAKELATDKSAEKNFIVNRWAAFKRLHVKYANDHIVPEDRTLWKEQTKQAEIRAELEAVQAEAAKLKERLGNEQRQYIRTQTSIHRHPQMMVKSVTLQKQLEGVLMKNAEVKAQLQVLENDVNHADKCSCVLMSDAISLVRLISDIDNQGAKNVIAANPCLKIIKRDVDERPEKPGEAKVNATIQKLAKAVNKIDSHSLDNPGDPDDKSSSSSDPSENEETDTVAEMEKKSVVPSRTSRRRTTTGALSKLRSLSVMSRRTRTGAIAPTQSSPEEHTRKATRKARATVIDQQPFASNSGAEAQAASAQDILADCAQLHKASVMGVERMKRFSTNPAMFEQQKKKKDPSRFSTVQIVEENDSYGKDRDDKVGRTRRSMSRRESQPANVVSERVLDKLEAEREKAEEREARRKAAQAARLLWKEEVAARKAKNRFAVVSDKIRRALPPDLAKMAQKMLEEEAEDPCGVKRLAKEQADLGSEHKSTDDNVHKLAERFLVMKAQCLKEITMLEAMSENEMEAFGSQDADRPEGEQPQGLLQDIADDLTDEQDMPPGPLDAEGVGVLGAEEAEGDFKRGNGKRKTLNRQNSRGRRASWVFRANRLWKKAQKAVIKERPESEEGLPTSSNETANKAWDDLLPGLISAARSTEGTGQVDDESFLGKENKKQMTRSEELAKSRWEFQKRAIKAAIAAQSERRRVAKEKARDREDAITSAMSISNDVERQNALNPLLEYTPTWDEALQMQLHSDTDGPLKKNRGQSILHVFKQRGVFRMFRSSFGKPKKEVDSEAEKERRSLRAHKEEKTKSLRKQRSKAVEDQWSTILASLNEDTPTQNGTLADDAEEGEVGGSEKKANASKQTPRQLVATEEEPSAVTASNAAAQSGHPGKVSMRCIASKGVAYCKSPDFSAFHEQTISVGSTVLVPEDQIGEAWVEVDGLWLPMKDASGNPNFETAHGTQGSKARSSLSSKAQKKSPRGARKAHLQAKFDLMGTEGGKTDSKKNTQKKTPSFVRQPSPAEVCEEAQSSDTSSEGSTDQIEAPARHHLSVGDLVVAKFPPNKGKDDNPWLAGRVTRIDTDTMRCSVQYENGESHADVKEDEVLFAPSRDDKWGTSQSRGSELVPDDAKQVKIKAPARHHLSVGDLVVAKFPPNKTKDDDPWLAGKVTHIDTDTMRCCVQYENGESHADVKADEVLFAPSRDDKWGTSQSRGSDLVPDDAKQVKIKAPARHRLAVGDLVVAKLPTNRIKDHDPWVAGRVTDIDWNMQECSIQFENGETHANVKADEVLFAPSRDDEWGIRHSRDGNDLVPDDAKQVKIKVSRSSVNERPPLASPVPHSSSVSLQPAHAFEKREPLVMQDSKKRQLGRRNGLNLFLHEFMCKDGKVLGRRTDFVSKAQVPQIWRLREESAEPVVKHECLGSEFHLRWYPVLTAEVPISRYNESSYCKVVKLTVEGPSKVHLEYEAVGDLVMQDPLMSRIIWQGGQAAACKSIPLPSDDVILEDEQSSIRGCLVFEGVNMDKCCMFKFGTFGYSEVAISFPLSVPMPADPVVNPLPKTLRTGEKLLRLKLLRELVSQREKHVQDMYWSPSNSRRQSTSKLAELLRVRPALRKEYVGQMLQRITVRGILRRRSQLIADANNILGTEGTDRDGALSVAFAIDGESGPSANQQATITEEGQDNPADPSAARAASIVSQGSSSRKNTRTLSIALPSGADDAEVERRHSRRFSENRSSLAARSRQASTAEKLEKSESQKSVLQTPQQNRERSLTFTLWIADEEERDAAKQKSEGRSSSKSSTRRQSRGSTAQAPSAGTATHSPTPEAVSQTPPKRSASKSSQPTPPGRTASQSSQPTPPRSRTESRVSRAESRASRAESRLSCELVDRALRSTSRDLGYQRSRSRLLSRASSVSLADQSIDDYWDHQGMFDSSDGLPLEKQASPMHVFSPSQGQDAPTGQTNEAEPRKMVRRLIEERSSDHVVPLPSLLVCKRRSRKSRADPASRAGSPVLNEAAPPDLPAPSPVRASLATRARPEDTTMGKARIAGNKLLALSALHSELGANSNDFFLDEKANFFKEAIELNEAAATMQEESPVQADRSRLTATATGARTPPVVHTPRRAAILLHEGNEERMDLEALIKVMQTEGHFVEQVYSSASSSADDSASNDKGIDSVCASIEAVPAVLLEEQPETKETLPEPTEKLPESREESPETGEKLPESTEKPPETRAKSPEYHHHQMVIPERQTASFYGSERRIGSVFRPDPQSLRQVTEDSMLTVDSSGLQCGTEDLPEDGICRNQGGKAPDFKKLRPMLRLFSKARKLRKPQSQETDLSLVGRRSLPVSGKEGAHEGTMEASFQRALLVQSISRPTSPMPEPEPAAVHGHELIPDVGQDPPLTSAEPDDVPDELQMPRAGSPQEKAMKTRRQAVVLNFAGDKLEEEMPAMPSFSDSQASQSTEEEHHPSTVEAARNVTMANTILDDMTSIVTNMVTAAEPTSRNAHSDGSGESKIVKEVPLRCGPPSQHKPSPNAMSSKLRADLGLGPSLSVSQQATAHNQELPSQPRTLAGSSSKKVLISSASAMRLDLSLKPVTSVSSESTEVTALPPNQEVFLQSSLESSTLSSGAGKLSDHAVHNVSLVEVGPELSELDVFSARNSSADDFDFRQQDSTDTPSSKQGLGVQEALGHTAAAVAPPLWASSSIHQGNSTASFHLDMSPSAPFEHLDSPSADSAHMNSPPAAAADTSLSLASHAVPEEVHEELVESNMDELQGSVTTDATQAQKEAAAEARRSTVDGEAPPEASDAVFAEPIQASNSVVMSAAAATAVIEQARTNMPIDQKENAPQICDSDKLPPGLAEILDSIDDADLVGLADNYQQAWRWESLGSMFDPANPNPKASELERIRQGTPRLSLLSGDSPLFNDNIGIQSERQPLGGYFRNDLRPRPRGELMLDDAKKQLDRIQYPRQLCVDARDGNTAATPLPLPEIEIDEPARAPLLTQRSITPMAFKGQRSCTGAPQRSPRVARDAQNAASKARAIPDRSPQAATGLPTMNAMKVKSVAASMLKGCKPPLQPNQHRASLSSTPMWEERSTRTPSPEAEIPLPALQSRSGTATVSPPWLLSVDPSPSPECREILRPGTAPGLPLTAGRRLPSARPESGMDVRREVATAGRESAGPRPESSVDVRRDCSGAHFAAGSRSGAQTSMGSRPGEPDTALHWQTGNVSWRQSVGSKAKLPQQRLRIDSLLRR